jgi:hypothetical protein
MHHIITPDYVDFAFIYSNDNIIETQLIKEGEKHIFNFEVSSKTNKCVCSLLGYGQAGGKTEYKLNDLLSVPINPDFPKRIAELNKQKDNLAYVPILVNTPLQVRYVLLEFPKSLVNLLHLHSQFIHLVHLDTTALKKQFTPKELLKRGVDIQGKTWITELEITIEDPSEKAMLSLQKIIAEYNIIVHCFSYTGLKEIKLTSDEKK